MPQAARLGSGHGSLLVAEKGAYLEFLENPGFFPGGFHRRFDSIEIGPPFVAAPEVHDHEGPVVTSPLEVYEPGHSRSRGSPGTLDHQRVTIFCLLIDPFLYIL